MDTEVTVPMPNLVAVIIGCLLGAAQALNQTTFALSASWHAYLGLGLVVAGYVGVKPLIGDQFRQSLGLPAWVSQLITGLAAAGTAALGLLPVGGSNVIIVARVVLATATTMLVALGFGPAASSAVASAAARRRAAKRGAQTRRARRR
jgi:hypothetical protein